MGFYFFFVTLNLENWAGMTDSGQICGFLQTHLFVLLVFNIPQLPDDSSLKRGNLL